MEDFYTLTEEQQYTYEKEYNQYLDELPRGPDPEPTDFFDDVNEYEDLEEEYIDDPYLEDEVITYEDLVVDDYAAERELDFN
jgi:hypothetical protein